MAQTTETENNFLTYENSTYGINIQYPRTWIAVDNLSRQSTQRNVDIVEFYDPNSTASLSISTDIISQTQDENVYLAEVIQSYRQDPTFTVIKTITNGSMLADQPGYELLYTTTNNDTGSIILSDEIGVLFAESVVYITYSADVKGYGVFRPIADQMVNSLKIDMGPTNETEFKSNSLGQLLQQGLTGEI
jgi:PsbP-like protein